MYDGAILASIPGFISIGAMFKAHPAMDGCQRIVFMEASNEGLDQQQETILAKALTDSSDYFLRYGNIDIDHYTKTGAKLGIPDYQLYEIGRPVDVRQEGKKTFVKAEIYSGTGPAAARANDFWASITEISPPQRWYPSVGGQVIDRAVEIDPKTLQPRGLIKAVRWSNIGLSKEPVNQHVATCATIPVGAFAKCWGADGLDIAKALEAGYGTNSADLSGGGALRKQSIEGRPINYFDFREKLATAMRGGVLKHDSAGEDLVGYSTKTFGLSAGEAAEWSERFVRDLKKRKAQVNDRENRDGDQRLRCPDRRYRRAGEVVPGDRR